MRQPPPARAEALERTVFTIDGVSFALLLPKRAVVRATDDALTVYGHTRLQRNIYLKKAHDGSPGSYNRKATLKNGRQLDYRINGDVGSGSGGTIAKLTGRLEIDSHILAVECTDQREGYPEADWCLPYLGSLEIVKKRAG